jgi:hypothetical protein
VNGIADTIRTHLSTHHGDTWRKVVVLEKLKGWDKVNCNFKAGIDPSEHEAFTVEGFLKRLARWVVVDDQVGYRYMSNPDALTPIWFSQSLNVVECQELRDLLLYLNADLSDDDIPHRTKLTQVIFESYNCEWKKLVDELQVSYL